MGSSETMTALVQRHRALQAGRQPSANGHRRSSTETLLVAARSLSQPFALTSLVVRAWKVDQQAFGLRGLEVAHPDAHKVYSLLYGQRGLINRGLLVREGEMFRALGAE